MIGLEAARPDFLNGEYPQRADKRVEWLDKLSARFFAGLRRLGPTSAHSQSFVASVRDFDDELRKAFDRELRQRIAELRSALISRGPQDALVAESFAITREVCRRQLGMKHHDVQIAGGFAMVKGKIAEMETGEGKTITALLPACLAALSGVPVHVITVNDFLVARDANELKPVYDFMGLTVGTVTEGIDIEERRKAYRADVTYCSNKQLAFDYLKDTLVLGQESRAMHLKLEGLYSEMPRSERLTLRGLCFGIVDEADSVLIDEAKTPLVISRKGEAGAEAEIFRDAIRVARQLSADLHFRIEAQRSRLRLTESGEQEVVELTRDMNGIWSGPKRSRELITQALSALHLYHEGVNYLVVDDSVAIIDEYTGRVMADRSWEGGLHQMIEAKENCEISGRQETLARISYQRFFGRYLRLCGMTGTAKEISSELWSEYRLGVEKIRTHLPLKRSAQKDLCFARQADKWQVVLCNIITTKKTGRPVLVGTRTVEDSEKLSEILRKSGIDHRVLNARDDAQEAAVIAQAGQPARITVATNMAGRGTDIRLARGISELGGLHVLSTCFHESRRIDRQLFGRSGRQGDQGSHQTIVSLEDEIFIQYLSPVIRRMLGQLCSSGRCLPDWLLACARRFIQRRAEAHHARMRRDMMKLDENLNDMLAFSGRPD